jgi:hypothetical protein
MPDENEKQPASQPPQQTPQGNPQPQTPMPIERPLTVTQDPIKVTKSASEGDLQKIEKRGGK